MALTLFLLVGCNNASGSDSSGPEDVTRAFYSAILENDQATFTSLLSPTMEQYTRSLLLTAFSLIQAQSDSAKDSVRVTGTTLRQGNEGVAIVDVTFKDGTPESLELAKAGNAWQVVNVLTGPAGDSDTAAVGEMLRVAEEFARACYSGTGEVVRRLSQPDVFINSPGMPGDGKLFALQCSIRWEFQNLSVELDDCFPPTPADVANDKGSACRFIVKAAYRQQGSTNPYSDDGFCLILREFGSDEHVLVENFRSLASYGCR